MCGYKSAPRERRRTLRTFCEILKIGEGSGVYEPGVDIEEVLFAGPRLRLGVGTTVPVLVIPSILQIDRQTVETSRVVPPSLSYHL